MPYVDGYVLTVPRKNIETYRKIARKAGKIWIEYGALEYRECVGDDMKSKFGVPFPKLANAKPSEAVVFSWIVFKSKAQRDRINEKVMKDPRLQNMMDHDNPPFDFNKMAFGGFEALVSLSSPA